MAALCPIEVGCPIGKVNAILVLSAFAIRGRRNSPKCSEIPKVVCPPIHHHPAQQDSCLTSLLKVCAASFKPSTIVR